MEKVAIDVFVISPFSDDNASIVEARIARAEQYIVELSERGLVAHSEIAFLARLAHKYDLPTAYRFWKKRCLTMLSLANEVHVLCEDGWETSEGVQDEIRFAEDLGINIKYIKSNDCTS